MPDAPAPDYSRLSGRKRDVALHRREDLPRGDRLEQHLGETRLEYRLVLILVHASADRDDGNGCGARVAFELGQRLHSIHAGHADVEQDEVEFFALCALQALESVYGGADGIACMPERGSIDDPAVFVVIDQQHDGNAHSGLDPWFLASPSNS